MRAWDRNLFCLWNAQKYIISKHAFHFFLTSDPGDGQLWKPHSQLETPDDGAKSCGARQSSCRAAATGGLGAAEDPVPAALEASAHAAEGGGRLQTVRFKPA